ncbi:hypothetical protein [Actinoplanes sp. N902-109]|uniref:hypothetical protein n=1 Tax=Actinoplanes sp. (strain N902-109) TaxID=649831 RepID=UPI0003293792|nr:hypothetical protein [Actinoplanes sp. N902-109]AGL14589.1 hypothetical protein L083_1079 [Actinoplanes sp. N902-109]
MVSCDISGTEKHVYSVRTTVDNDRLQVQWHQQGDSAGAVISFSGPEGTPDCSIGGQLDWCEAPVAGVYTFTVTLYFDDDRAHYVLGADSWSTPSSCKTLDESFFALDGPGLDGSLPAGSPGDCYRFDGRAGDELKGELTGAGSWLLGTVVNAAGERSCQFSNAVGCTLSGTGPYQFFLYEGYGSATDYHLGLVRVTRPIGCGTLRTADFGDLDATEHATGTLGPNRIACRTFTSTAGQHIVQIENTNSAYWSIRDAANAEVCSKWGSGIWCLLPADGTYTLLVENTESWGEVQFDIAVTSLTGNAGCADRTGTSWAEPATQVKLNSSLALACLPFEATPGERVEAKATPGYGWITDDTGTRICPDYDPDGCVLPGSGPYRLLAWYSAYGDPEIGMEVRSLTTPTGCPTLAPGSFGTAPTGLSTIRCRALTVPAAGSYLVRAVTEDNYERSARIYDPAGARVACDTFCTLAAGQHTLVVDDSSAFAVTFVPASAPGCATATDQGATAAGVAGTFAGAGQVDCYRLPTAAGATVSTLLPTNATAAAYPDVSYVDATGRSACYSGSSACQLTGQAPFRVLVSAREDYPTGAYQLGFQRTDGLTGCAAFPAGQLGSTTGATVSFTADRWATCLAIPAGQHATQELVAFTQTAGSGKARLSVYDNSTGATACYNSLGVTSAYLTCTLTAGHAYSAVVVGGTAPATYRVTRRDATPAGAKCSAAGATTIGSKGATGSITARDDLRCYRITAATTDSYFVGVRSHDESVHFWITDATGKQLDCIGYYMPCRVSGSTGYQVFLAGVGDTLPAAYELDTWKVASAAGLPAECPAVASAAYGFGPLEGVLDSAKPAVCLQIQARSSDTYLVATTNTEGGEDLPQPFLLSGSGTIRNCDLTTGGRQCYVNAPDGKALFIMWGGWELGRYPFRAEATCNNWGGICAGARYTATSFTPASATVGGKTTITVRGTALNAEDVVRLSANGQPAITAKTRSVSADRTTLTAEADLTTAAAGARTVTVTPGAIEADPVTLPSTLTLTLPALKSTKAPSISGTVRVGSKVTANVGSWTPAATSYTYKWMANGTAISGATGSAYPVGAAVAGKKLTVVITAKRSGHPSGTGTSAAVTVAKGTAPKATKAPAITGTAKKNATVKVAAGTWSLKPDSYAYQWRLNGVAIKGATKSSLKVTASMAGKKLTVMVTAKRAGYTDGTATTKAVTVKK